MIGAIEAGGTKFVCGIGNEHGEILDRISFPTEEAQATTQKAVDYFKDKNIEALGVGSFGPLDLDINSKTYGHVTTTPKPGWANYDLLGHLKKELDVPVGFDTDVNAAAFGEARFGAAQDLDSCLYYTVGTGIGVGVYAGGQLVHGLVHPEGGHVPVRRHPDDTFEGTCPYHHDCLEGMAAGPAIGKRWGQSADGLAEDHAAWKIEAHYLAEAITSAILLLSPKKIILGGGVMHQTQLFPLIREQVSKNLNGYVASSVLENMSEYIVSPGLGDNAGLVGSLALGIEAVSDRA
ncbi:ROK family protein [Saccharibacillus sp. JS10]|nr:ROK family protein [Saccharibacillus sp. JS10]